jgi:hypothetical protein
MNRFIDTSFVALTAIVGQAIALVPTGLYVLVAATIVLFQNEARTDWGNVVSDSLIGPVAPDTAFDGVNMTVTAPLTGDRAVGDPVFFEPGDFVTAIRSVETYAWVETVTESVDRKWGGGAEVTTETVYTLEWASDPLHSDGFRYPEGHENPRSRFDDHFELSELRLGEWVLNPMQSLILYNEPVRPGTVRWTPEGAALRYVADEDGSNGAFYYGDADPHAPRVGDTRMTFHVVPSGVTMTAVGYGAGHSIGGIEWFDSVALVPVLPGGRDDAQAFMGGIFQISVWLGRVGGAIGVLFGLWLVVGPLFAILDIAPPIGILARICAAVALIPCSLAWAALVVFFSQLLHSWFMLSVLGFLIYLWVRTAIDRRREERANCRARVFYGSRAK